MTPEREKIASLRRQLEELDCAAFDTAGLIHCPPGKPCLQHRFEFREKDLAAELIRVRAVAERATRDEREACARAVEAVFERWSRPEYGLLRGDIAAAIRARGKS